MIVAGQRLPIVVATRKKLSAVPSPNTKTDIGQVG